MQEILNFVSGDSTEAGKENVMAKGEYYYDKSIKQLPVEKCVYSLLHNHCRYSTEEGERQDANWKYDMISHMHSRISGSVHVGYMGTIMPRFWSF